MSLELWIYTYILSSIWWKWLLSWGGAEKIEGWSTFFFISWLALDWDSEQIRLFALIMWVIQTILFVLGIFDSDWRCLRSSS